MSFLKKVKLGRGGIDVTELCFGTLPMSRLQADLSPQAMIPVFQKALELGITFYDVAHRFSTYEHTRLGLGKDIDKVVLASKTDAKTLPEAKEQIDLCFRTLDRDMIDIFLLHQVEDEADFQARRPIVDLLLDLKRKGRIRATGLSSHRISGNEVAIRHADELDILFPVINQKGLGIIDGDLQAGLESLRRAKQAGLGVYAMKPLGGGHLRRDVPGAITFLRQNNCVAAIAVGMKSVEEVKVNVGVFSDGRFAVDRDMAKRLISADRRTLVNFLCKRCGACQKHCDQGALSLGEKKAQVDEDKCIFCG